MSKYIIELKDDVQVVQKVGVTENGNAFVMNFYKDQLEELNSDYINEHYPTMLQDAYDRGYKDGRNVTETQAHDDAYHLGLNDAWECARKIVCDDRCGGMSMKELDEIFNRSSDAYILRDFTAQQAIEMLKAHKQKKDNKIGVGDIIANNTEPKLKAWVTCFDEIGFCGIAITDFGIVDRGKLYSSCSPKGWHKIGHFDITKILEDLKHD